MLLNEINLKKDMFKVEHDIYTAVFYSILIEQDKKCVNFC